MLSVLSPVLHESFYPCCFQEFLLIFGFRSLTILCQCMYPSVLITLAISWVSQICILMLFIISGKYFGHYYFKYLFLPFLSLFLSHYAYVSILDGVSQMLKICTFSSIFYFLFFRKLDNFYWFIKFTDSSFDIWNLVLSPSRTFFNYRTFQLQNLFLLKIISIVTLKILVWRVIIVIFYLII